MNFPVSGQQTRPNIVLLLADDWGFPHATPYGDKVVDSRVFDSVAAEGMLFTKAYSAAPHSSPSRACILGRMLRPPPGRGLQPQLVLSTRPDRVPGTVGKGWLYDSLLAQGMGPGVFSQTGWEHNPVGHEVQNLAEWIEQAPADKPICAWMGSRRPHRPYSVGSGEEHGFCPDSLKLCPDLPDAPAIR